MDIVLVLIMGIGIFIGYKKGFIRALFSLIGMLLAIILALISYKTVVANIVPKTGLDKKVYEYVEKRISSNETFINMPQPLQKYLDADVIINQAQSTAVEKISNFIINIATIIVLIIVFYIIITLIRIVLDNVAKLPIFNIFNKIGGAILGAIKSFAFILILFAAISFSIAIGKFEFLIGWIDSSVVSKKIYYNNPISNIVVSKQLDKNIEGEEKTNEEIF